MMIIGTIVMRSILKCNFVMRSILKWNFVKRFLLEYKWIALGTVLEWFYTFWLFLIHWLAFPYRCAVRVYSIILLRIFKKK